MNSILIPWWSSLVPCLRNIISTCSHEKYIKDMECSANGTILQLIDRRDMKGYTCRSLRTATCDIITAISVVISTKKTHIMHLTNMGEKVSKSEWVEFNAPPDTIQVILEAEKKVSKRIKSTHHMVNCHWQISETGNDNGCCTCKFITIKHLT